jgi:hypothetical protein
MTTRLSAFCIVAVLSLVGSTSAQERKLDVTGGYAIVNDRAGSVDFFGADGRPTGSGRVDSTGRRIDFVSPGAAPSGYAIVDPVSGRINFFDAGGRIAGSGRVDSDGRVERFDPAGARLPDIVIPLPIGPR